MHKEILTKAQIELFPLLKKVGKDYGLVGGTAIALYVGHRRSIDFDLFSYREFKNIFLEEKIKSVIKIDKVLVDKEGELTFFAKGVKITFFRYPLWINYSEDLAKVIRVPNLITLAAMKAYALGKRAKWKDYVDLYFIIKNHHSIAEITKKGNEIFGNEFNEKLFRIQLSYFDDVDYREEIEYLPSFEVSEKEIKKRLVEFSLE
ncbi:MAG: nucleotidyl transferase AbiEii/AbiGii toxin family protein [Candidatus Portnoybacteria bacterium]|nr:nucleotidyl transferase AbiEii/AbiGii toxin family protein [Candidatus Portnoybacteria bacterium]